MKRFFAILLAFVLILALCPAFGAVSVNEVFNYADADWGKGTNPASNGLWKYEWLARETGVISDMVWSTSGYFEAPFTTAAASDTHWYCRVRSGGADMHPGAQADSIKTFICPEEGKVDFKVVCNRANDVTGDKNGNSACVYLNDKKVWPADKDYVELNDKNALTVEVSLDVKKGDLIRFMIGSLGNSSSDAVKLQEHSVTYRSGANLTPEVKNYTIACVGDSVTEGMMTTGGLKGKDAYPAQLQGLLNKVSNGKYTVKNYGCSARTALVNGDRPYHQTSEYTSSMASNPDVVIICFGANDSKVANWNAEAFRKDYTALIKGYQDLPSKPTVYLFYTTYIANQELTGCRRDVIQNEILPIEYDIAKELGCKIIDLNTLTKENADKYADGVHPNDQLQKMMAQYIFDALCCENAIELTVGDASDDVFMIDPNKTESTDTEQNTDATTTDTATPSESDTNSVTEPQDTSSTDADCVEEPASVPVWAIVAGAVVVVAIIACVILFVFKKK